MHIYKLIKRYDTRTGREVNPALVEERHMAICDATGKLIDVSKDYEQTPLYTISIKYNHDSEPVWYEDFHPLEKEFGIGYGDFSKFMDSPYHFHNADGYDSTDITITLCQEWMRAIRSKKNPRPRFADCGTIDQVFREVRLETLRRLLREKKFTTKELGFQHMSDNV